MLVASLSPSLSPSRLWSTKPRAESLSWVQSGRGQEKKKKKKKKRRKKGKKRKREGEDYVMGVGEGEKEDVLKS